MNYCQIASRLCFSMALALSGLLFVAHQTNAIEFSDCVALEDPASSGYSCSSGSKCILSNCKKVLSESGQCHCGCTIAEESTCTL